MQKPLKQIRGRVEATQTSCKSAGAVPKRGVGRPWADDGAPCGVDPASDDAHGSSWPRPAHPGQGRRYGRHGRRQSRDALRGGSCLARGSRAVAHGSACASTLGKQLAPESCDMCRWRRQPPGISATANALSGRSMRLGAEAVLPTLPAVHLSRRKAAMLERSELPARMRRELAGACTPHVCRTGCAHHRHAVGTPWAHRLHTCLTGRLRSASQVEWVRGLEVDLDANVFSRRFCSCTSRSGQLNRYAWQAIGLQSWCGKTASRHNSTCTRPMARAAARESRPNLEPILACFPMRSRQPRAPRAHHAHTVRVPRALSEWSLMLPFAVGAPQAL